MVKVVLVSGYKRSGKDFVSKKLSELLGGVEVMALAEPLKDIIATSMSLSKEALEEYKNAEALICVDDNVESFGECITNFRSLLQRFGTEAMKKHFGDDVWVDLFISKLPLRGCVIVSDWRFISEYRAIAHVVDEVVTVRVDDDNLTGDGHISERELDDFEFDVRVDNTAKDDSVLYELKALAKIIELRNTKPLPDL